MSTFLISIAIGHDHHWDGHLCFVTDPFLVPCKHVHLELRPGRKVLNLKLVGGCLKQNQSIQYHETKVIIEIQLYYGHPIKIIIAKWIVRIRIDHLHHHNCRSDPICIDVFERGSFSKTDIIKSWYKCGKLIIVIFALDIQITCG